jgi:hypothetical protein
MTTPTDKTIRVTILESDIETLVNIVRDGHDHSGIVAHILTEAGVYVDLDESGVDVDLKDGV